MSTYDLCPLSPSGGAFFSGSTKLRNTHDSTTPTKRSSVPNFPPAFWDIGNLKVSSLLLSGICHWFRRRNEISGNQIVQTLWLSLKMLNAVPSGFFQSSEEIIFIKKSKEMHKPKVLDFVKRLWILPKFITLKYETSFQIPGSCKIGKSGSLKNINNLNLSILNNC